MNSTIPGGEYVGDRRMDSDENHDDCLPHIYREEDFYLRESFIKPQLHRVPKRSSGWNSCEIGHHKGIISAVYTERPIVLVL